MSALGRRRADERSTIRRRRPYVRANRPSKERRMLWLIIGIILLVIAIAGGVIVHPLLFILAIIALLMFVFGRA